LAPDFRLCPLLCLPAIAMGCGSPLTAAKARSIVSAWGCTYRLEMEIEEWPAIRMTSKRRNDSPRAE